MAERRMFSKKIMGSDTFMDMPVSAQMFYVHLSMQADDDGFVGNPKTVQRMTGCGAEDFNELVDENFIIPFQSGVIAITHWKVNNRVRGDRYKETIYLKEKSRLRETATETYELIPEGEASGDERNPNGIPSDSQADTNGIPSDNQADTNGITTVSKRYSQYSIGKDSIGKDSIGKFSSVEVSPVSSSAEVRSLKEEKNEKAEEAEEAEETNNKKEKGRENESPIMVLPLRDGKEYPLYSKHVSTWDFMYPLVDVEKEFVRMKTFLDEHPEERITSGSVNMFMMNWLRGEQEKIKKQRA